ncbi:hypothetical protein [Granulosicoccus antarcticus]|uniref:Auto-transporter adhesin head GIN domain-containing protein n=1 Tax=Granulosicoccus antarcticus IMCC3135 TaxID=1192854 RepID=A0A2Z2NXT2_9GAMM|nr:hypothetical protein [Granulosicoccus antarcticus]ASJ74558.1 hypothetical protein IMCC3135_22440 [Granulosicoccus antarcticus IMCC3135]
MNVRNPQGCKNPWALTALTILLASCSSSDGTPAVDDGDTPVDQPGEVIDTDPTVTPLIMALNSRNLGIDVLEFIDTLNYTSIVIPESILTLSIGEQDCASGGRYTALAQESQTEFNFSDCSLSATGSSPLTGQLSITTNGSDTSAETRDIDVRYESGFAIQNGQRVVTIEGRFLTVSTDNEVSVSSDSLIINDNQGDLTVTTLQYGKTATENAQSTISVESNINSSRFGFTFDLSTSPNMTANQIFCPTAGTLIVTATDSSTLTVQGAEGDNVLIGSDTDLDTVNCSEISSLENNSNQTVVITPPAPPGG